MPPPRTPYWMVERRRRELALRRTARIVIRAFNRAGVSMAEAMDALRQLAIATRRGMIKLVRTPVARQELRMAQLARRRAHGARVWGLEVEP